jgi:hypothetical protein
MNSKIYFQAGCVAQAIERLSIKREALSSKPSTSKQGDAGGRYPCFLSKGPGIFICIGLVRDVAGADR